jgi:hypothetical protein
MAIRPLEFGLIHRDTHIGHEKKRSGLHFIPSVFSTSLGDRLICPANNRVIPVDAGFQGFDCLGIDGYRFI